MLAVKMTPTAAISIAPTIKLFMERDGRQRQGVGTTCLCPVALVFTLIYVPPYRTFNRTFNAF